MCQVWVPSAFNRDSFVDSGVDPTKIRVLPEAFDTQSWNPKLAEAPLETPGRTAGFTFLSVFKFGA